MSSISTSNVTSGFIDLATFDEIEKYLYGGPDATAYFVRETRKATWFTQVPVVLSRASGSPAFNQEWSVSISRSGDYLLQTWMRLQTPSVTLNPGNQYGSSGSIRWCKNLMHNIIRECAITFNDLVAARFDSFHLDFWAAFTVPAGKRNGYANMIGTTDELTAPHNATGEFGPTLPSLTLNLPLPFFYGRNSGIALPTAALPYNDMRINFSFRNWTELLILENYTIPTPNVESRTTPNVPTDITNTPTLGYCQVWANYAIVSNDERKRMACAPRDILIEQVQTAPRQTFVPSQNSAPSFDIRFSHAIKVLFFSVRNNTCPAEWSNYTCASPIPKQTMNDESPSGAVDPIIQASLIYENSQRLSQMGSDYFSLVNPFFHAPAIPLETGYHMYSYSLDFISLDPMASTNFGKLTNVSMVPEASDGAKLASLGTGVVGSGADFKQTFEFIVTAVNNNIIRVSGGALGYMFLTWVMVALTIFRNLKTGEAKNRWLPLEM